MNNHEPENYDCPFCAFLQGRESKYNNKKVIVDENSGAVAFMCPMTWSKNHGNVIVVPRLHIENIYTLADETTAEIYVLVRKVSLAIRESYGCSGVTIVQRNEPDAGQHVWHLHVHIAPRFEGDGSSEKDQTEFADATNREYFAQKLRDYLNSAA